jgi:iron complex transport system substrate-binding protein
LPSATEIVAALDFREELLGRSHECDFPEWVRLLPVLTMPAFSPDRASREIDRQVQALLERGLSLYRVDTEKLQALRPDFIVTQSQCEVCAVSEGELERALSDWVGRSARIVSLRGNTLNEVWEDIVRVAAELGVPERGRNLVGALQARVDRLSSGTQALRDRPTVACIEWLDPLMAAGNWIPELVERAGGMPLFSEAGNHSPWLDWETLRNGDPDVIVVFPCGFDIARTRQELSVLQNHSVWQGLSAVKKRRVYLADGNQYFNRPGPRLVESIQILAEILHPKMFEPRERGRAWVPA